MFILDTNAISWLQRQREESLFLSVITVGEIERGVAQESSRNPAFSAVLLSWLEQTTTNFADRILPFGAAEARVWGQLSGRLGHGGAKLLIAETVIVCGAVVVTENVSDFLPTGVPVENPF